MSFRDEGGAVLIYVSLALTVFIGGAALAIDAARLYNLQTQLQAAADSFALVAAAELDRRDDAFTRAQRALGELVKNRQNFAVGTNDIGIASVQYFATLPPDDQPIAGATVAALPADARFVRVVVNTRTINNIFAQVIGGGATTNTSASAVAGFDSAVCKFTPLFICNPVENTGVTIHEALESTDLKKRLLQLKTIGGNNAAYFPGDFGLLETPGQPGANALRDMLARVNPSACFIQNGVQLKTGQVASIQQAINVRFDRYAGNFNSKKNDPNYRPASNVTKGYVGPACNSSPDTSNPPKAMQLPRDSCFATNNCPNASGRMGDGIWDFTAYWNLNHPTLLAPNGWSNSPANIPSRYEVYRWEIDNNKITNNVATGGENGNPQCYAGGVGTLGDDPDRRMLYAAVLNCQTLAITGASGGPAPVEAFVRLFITEPLGTGVENTVWVEIVSVLNPGVDSDVLRDVVQLYR